MSKQLQIRKRDAIVDAQKVRKLDKVDGCVTAILQICSETMLQTINV